ncbi:uncharacterized protein LOC120323876 isoform X2 [Pipra filicauda]|uniref:Uncharacterized protein LOC120323876 isoform X2 n=1 Tax=Pipra filicauda TaxID=649802 RepID=A0A7R5KS24_9PASS|nr:uncharacterized protein LOC120323876 isoform X2 [Pipra filicauda]
MALALRLFLLLLLAVALHARAAQAAPVPARGADENTGNASPLDWLRKVLQPLQPPAGVSAGRTVPTPFLVPRPKLLSHGRGPPRGKSQRPGEKKTQMDQEAVHKLMFPKGSSGSVPGSAEGREAMPGTGTRDDNTGNASPLDWLRKVLGPLQPPARVSAGRTFPAPLLVAPPKLLSHGRGPPRGKSQRPGEKKTHESNEVLKEILKELQKGQEMDRGALWQAAFPEGSSGSVPGSAEGREAMPGTGTRGVSAGRTFPAPLLIPLSKTTSYGMNAAGATTRAPKIQESTGRDFCWGTGCLSVIVASVLEGLLVFLLCCAGIWYWRVRKRLLSAPAPAQPNTSGRKSWTSHLCSSCPKPAVLTRLKNGLLSLLVQLPGKGAPLPPSPVAPPSSPV